jgi:hypothetical protein
LAIRFGSDPLFKQSTKIVRQSTQAVHASLVSIIGGAPTSAGLNCTAFCPRVLAQYCSHAFKCLGFGAGTRRWRVKIPTLYRQLGIEESVSMEVPVFHGLIRA